MYLPEFDHEHYFSTAPSLMDLNNSLEWLIDIHSCKIKPIFIALPVIYTKKSWILMEKIDRKKIRHNIDRKIDGNELVLTDANIIRKHKSIHIQSSKPATSATIPVLWNLHSS